MKLNTVNIREMTCKNPKWDVLLGLPELRSSIIGTRDKVLAKRRKLHLPDWKAVTMEHIHEASFLQRPESNYESNETDPTLTCAILWTGQEPLFINWNTKSIDWTWMTNENELLLGSLVLSLWFRLPEADYTSLWVHDSFPHSALLRSLINLKVLAGHNIDLLRIKYEDLDWAVLEPTDHVVASIAQSDCS